MKGKVIEMHSDTLFYIKDNDGDITGVGDSSGGRVEFISHRDYVTVHVDGLGIISKVKLKELCIAWLALNYPDSLKFDDEEPTS